MTENIKEMKTCVQVSFEVMIPVDTVFSHGDGSPEDGFVDSRSILLGIKEYLNRRHHMELDMEDDADITMREIGIWIEDICEETGDDTRADVDITIWQDGHQLYDGRKRPMSLFDKTIV